jgi:hypothetical protein
MTARGTPLGPALAINISLVLDQRRIWTRSVGTRNLSHEGWVHAPRRRRTALLSENHSRMEAIIAAVMISVPA